MQVHTYLAESVADAVSQIRETLGPEAVVLNVRRLPAEGLARLWQKPRIEVLAAKAPMSVAPAQAYAYIHNPLSEFRGGRNASMARLFSSHPPTEERIARLRAMTF